MTWDARLITPERVFEKSGEWAVYVDVQFAELSQFEMEGGGKPLPDQWQANLRCAACHQSCGMLMDHTGPLPTSVSDLASGVLRHMVMAHDVSLSGAPQPPIPRGGEPLPRPEVRPPWDA